VRAHWPAFLERAEEAGGLPRFVVREVEAYLECGLLAHGLVQTRSRRRAHRARSHGARRGDARDAAGRSARTAAGRRRCAGDERRRLRVDAGATCRPIAGGACHLARRDARTARGRRLRGSAHSGAQRRGAREAASGSVARDYLTRHPSGGLVSWMQALLDSAAPTPAAGE